MIDINSLRIQPHRILAWGSHIPILQSMLDYDYLCGKSEPDLAGIIASGRRYLRLFWGDAERLVPVYPSLSDLPDKVMPQVRLMLNLTSGRRTMSSTLDGFSQLPHLQGGALFAENVPEQHALQIGRAISPDQWVIGPASVGLLIPGSLKLGPIGGTQAQQFAQTGITSCGNIAVFSSSGGMTNELIHMVAQSGRHISFALSFGGDRFPVMSPKTALLAAQADPSTQGIVYFGELGGYDEYDMAEALREGKITKPIVAYIGGSVSDMFPTPPQFGHAKAMAARGNEAAVAKVKALQDAGVVATTSFSAFSDAISKTLPKSALAQENERVLHERSAQIASRSPKLFLASVSRDSEGSVSILGEDLLSVASGQSWGEIVGSMLLGKKLRSQKTAACIEFILKLLVDHGPYVSGAVNTMIAARAGKDVVSSLASGLLTIGPRFGGAINEAAAHWIEGVTRGVTPGVFVEEVASAGTIISGIGHRKYRIDAPDPRVGAMVAFVAQLRSHPHTTFAQGVEKITTAKKGNLILNVDGAIAAVLLDVLQEEESFTPRELRELVAVEFFNALFVLSRSVGFTAHYLDQRRHDEGLFRLSPREVGWTE